MNLGNVLVAIGGIDAILLEDGKDRKIPFRARARLMRIRDVFRGETQLYEAERIKLVKQLGVEVEKDGEKVLNVPDDKLDEFYKELEKVLSTESEVTYKKMSAEEFKDIEELDITVTDAQLKALYDFVFDSSVV